MSDAARRWQAIIQQHSASGLSIAEFCRQRELTENSFYSWRKRLQEETPFVPLQVVESASIEIEIPGGAVVRVAAGDRQGLRNVLAVLFEQAAS